MGDEDEEFLMAMEMPFCKFACNKAACDGELEGLICVKAVKCTGEPVLLDEGVGDKLGLTS